MKWFQMTGRFERTSHTPPALTPEERRAALAKMAALDKMARQNGGISLTEQEFGENAPIDLDTSEMDFTPEPVQLVGIEAEGYRNATQAMLDAATQRDNELAAAIQKNQDDAKAEDTRLKDERAKNRKIIESTLAALSVFGTSEPQMPRAEAKPEIPHFLRFLPRNVTTPIVIFGPKGSGKSRNIVDILGELNRLDWSTVDEWGGESVLPPKTIATTRILPENFESRDRKTDYCWINIENFHVFPWWQGPVPAPKIPQPGPTEENPGPMPSGIPEFDR